MRHSSARKRLLCIATLIGASLFSLMASATTLEAIVVYDPTLGPTYQEILIRIVVTGNSPTGYVVINPNGYAANVNVVDGLATWRGPISAANHIATANYPGDAANPPASLTFNVGRPTLDWIPTVIERLLLSD